MHGYLLNFYKYSLQGKDTIFDNNYDNSFIRSIVWSTFDRLEIRQISEFKEYRQSQYSEINWVGERQFAMLYDVSDTTVPPRLSFSTQRQNVDKCKFPFTNSEDPAQKYNFFGVSMLDISQEFCNYIYSKKTPGKEFRNEFLKAIDFIIEKNDLKEGLCYEVYCTLGGNDLVIIWLTNQFKSIITVIEALRAPLKIHCCSEVRIFYSRFMSKRRCHTDV